MSAAPRRDAVGEGRLHLGYLDGLRALAALFVVVHHIRYQFRLWEAPLAKWQVHLVEVLGYGHHAVDVFIVLSGFCLMLPVARHGGALRSGALDFFKKRAWRILPPYYLAMALSLLLIGTVIGEKTGTHWDTSIPVSRWDILAHVLLVQDLASSTATKINHVFWSISVEWRIYFLFPLLVLVARRIGTALVALLSVVSSYAVFFLLQPSGLYMGPWGMCPHYVGLFALGMLAAEMAFSRAPAMTRLRDRLPWGLLSAIGVVAVAVSSKLPVWGGQPVPWYWTDLVVGVATVPVLLASLPEKGGVLGRVLAWRPLVFLGTFAYSIYLFHAPLIQVLWQFAVEPLQLGPWAGFYLLLGVGTPIIVAGCYLFHLVCERPFLRWNGRPALRRSSRSTAGNLRPAEWGSLPTPVER